MLNFICISKNSLKQRNLQKSLYTWKAGLNLPTAVFMEHVKSFKTWDVEFRSRVGITKLGKIYAKKFLVIVLYCIVFFAGKYV